MSPLVPGQGSLALEGFPASRALVGHLLPVGTAPVAWKLGAGPQASSADRALVGRSGVGLPVGEEVGAEAKGRVALFALVGLVSSVDPLVDEEV